MPKLSYSELLATASILTTGAVTTYSPGLYQAHPDLPQPGTPDEIGVLMEKVLGLPPVLLQDPINDDAHYVRLSQVNADLTELNETTVYAGIGAAFITVTKGLVRFNYFAHGGPGYESRRAFMLDYYDRIAQSMEKKGLQVERSMEPTAKPQD
jgi:hypothetical protein